MENTTITLIAGVLAGAILTGLIITIKLFLSIKKQETKSLEDSLSMGEMPDGLKIIVSEMINDIEKDERKKRSSLEHFKARCQKEIDKHTESECYEEAHQVFAIQESSDNWFIERKEWFLERIGRRVFASRIFCPCEHCEVVVKDGIVIEDEKFALTLFHQENSAKINLESDLNYYD